MGYIGFISYEDHTQQEKISHLINIVIIHSLNMIHDGSSSKPLGKMFTTSLSQII